MKIIIKINRLKLFKNVVKKYQKSQPLVPKLFLKTKTQKYCKIKSRARKLHERELCTKLEDLERKLANN